MKMKAFLSLLLAGLVCMASFISCDKDEDTGDTYAWNLSIVLTEPGDLTPAEVAILNAYISQSVSETGTLYLTVAKAQEAFNLAVAAMQNELNSQSFTNTKTIKLTMSFLGTASDQGTFIHTFTIAPK